MAQNRKAEVDAALKDVDFDKNKYQIELDTTMGKILLDMLPDVAPGHCRNLIGLAKIGYYDSLIFHRVIEGFMIQGGCPEGTRHRRTGLHHQGRVQQHIARTGRAFDGAHQRPELGRLAVLYLRRPGAASRPAVHGVRKDG